MLMVATRMFAAAGFAASQVRHIYVSDIDLTVAWNSAC